MRIVGRTLQPSGRADCGQGAAAMGLTSEQCFADDLHAATCWRACMHAGEIRIGVDIAPVEFMHTHFFLTSTAETLLETSVHCCTIDGANNLERSVVQLPLASLVCPDTWPQATPSDRVRKAAHIQAR